jgi:cytochrome c
MLMRISFLIACGTLIASAAYGQAVEAPKAWTTCSACHAPGSAALGPSLNGVIGRKAGSMPGFTYSRAMKSANITWDEASLTAFVGDPQKVVPGNRMPFAGLSDAGEVAEIVRFLKTLR